MDLQQLEAHLDQYPNSPLFARLALEYIQAGKFTEAIELCHKGLSLYPAYAAGHLVLAKCYAQEASYEMALASLEAAHSHVSFFPLYEILYEQWSAPTGIPPGKRPAYNPEPQVMEETPEIPAVESAPPQITEQEIQPDISNEELQQIQRPAGSDADEWRIVSKTLAEIFANQGEYDEAIITYRLLIQEQPDQKDVYEGRIEELIKLREEKMLNDNEQKSPDNPGPS